MSQAPSAPHGRIVTVDVLRGFALLGMLYAHFMFWYAGALLPEGAYPRPDGLASRLALALNGWLAVGKFFSLFAFLFGLSFWLQLRSLEQRSSAFAARYAWRLAILGGIGLVHHAFWRGDVLALYALLGLGLLPARRLGGAILLALALVLVTNLPHRLVEAGLLVARSELPRLDLAVVEEASRHYAVLKGGTLLELVRDNWSALPSKLEYQLASGRLGVTFGFFLLGMHAGRRGWFEGEGASPIRIAGVCRASALVLMGVAVAAVLLPLLDGSSGAGTTPWARWRSELLFGSLFDPALTLFYASGLALLLRRRAWQRILHPLAAVGRMALTSYLCQTLFGLLLFGSFGLGLFGRTTAATNALLALGLFSAQAGFAHAWLRGFRQGPVEWLWRSATWLEPQPLRVATRDPQVRASPAARAAPPPGRARE